MLGGGSGSLEYRFLSLIGSDVSAYRATDTQDCQFLSGIVGTKHWYGALISRPRVL